MAFCPKCGAKMGGSFCPKCGAKVGGGGGAQQVSMPMVTAACLFIVAGVVFYGVYNMSKIAAASTAAFLTVPIAILAAYLGYECFNKKKWVQPWAVVFGFTMFLTILPNFTIPQLPIVSIIGYLAMAGAAVFAVLGKSDFDVEDKENPVGKLTQ